MRSERKTKQITNQQERMSNLVDLKSEDPIEAVIRALDLCAPIQECLKLLTYRERETIRLRFGIEDGYTHTGEEIGKLLGVTRERVRQLEAKAIRKLWGFLASR